jgi:hypothetical protein
MFHYGILTKIFPLLFIVPTFLITSIWTREGADQWLNNAGLHLTPSIVLYTVILTYTGIMFLIETAFALPEFGKSNAGVFGAVLLASIAIGTFLFAGAIFTGLYNPQDDIGTTNVVLSIIMLMAIGMFIAQGREEIFHFRRLSMHRVFNS